MDGYVRRKKGLNEQALARVLAYIDERLGEKLGLVELAQVACVSRAHFARMFRISTGQTPMEYVVNRRVERARRELARGSGKLCALALELGFADQSHLTRIFRRLTGYTPRAYATRFSPALS